MFGAGVAENEGLRKVQIGLGASTCKTEGASPYFLFPDATRATWAMKSSPRFSKLSY